MKPNFNNRTIWTGDNLDTLATFAARDVGKRLRYRELIADNGLPSGARL